MTRIVRHSLAILAVLAFAVPAAYSDEHRDAESVPAHSLLAIRNARIPMDGLLSGGQPSETQVEAAALGGFRTVINLRTEQEKGYEWEAETVEGLGMRYISIPIDGKNFTRETVERFDAALGESLAQGPVLLHCASGNRIGAILALRAGWLQETDAEEALKYGKASGMTRLEPVVRELLGLPPVEPPDPPKAPEAPAKLE